MTTVHRITLRVNGQSHDCELEARMTLADCLREKLDLTGTHLGCEHGVCGACTVLVDGTAVRACLMFAVQAQGAKIVTVEGLASADGMTPLQEAFRDHHALQCGFCTPGFLTTATALLADTPEPTRDEIRHAVSGNLCRCTGYVPIVDAILDTAGRIRQGKKR
jgi:carbon-monoxide dehydrogenase small subunit